MKLISDGKWYKVPSDLVPDKSLLLNYTQKKGSKYIQVEDCLVNEIVLESIIAEPVSFTRAYYTPECSSVVDESLKSKLRDYQYRDVERMLSQRNSLNRNKMGLGKTIEAVALMRSLNARTVLICLPKSTILQWRDKIREWWPEVAESILITPREPRRGSICIYNYDQLSRKSELVERLRSINWDLFICDEAHRIKNPTSKRTKSVEAIPAVYRLALTGTPIVSRPNDLWSILHWLDPRYSGRNYWSFVYYFCNIKKDFWGEKIEGLTTNVFRCTVLRKLLYRVSVSNDIRVASGKTRVDVLLEMSSSQRSLYNKTKKLVLDELPEKLTVANGAVLCTRLQQISSWPGTFSSEGRDFGPGTKFEWIKDFIEDNPSEKLVIYTRFARTAEALKSFLRVPSVLYIGELSSQERERAKRQFIEEPEIRAIIGTTGAMGEGVDGLQLVSRTAVFIDRDWLPSTLEQCEDRLNRMGQKYPVMCYYLDCEKSFDQYIGKISMNKAEDIRRALENDDN